MPGAGFNGELVFDDAVARDNANLRLAEAAKQPETAWLVRAMRSEGLTIRVRFEGSIHVSAWDPALVLVRRVAGHAVRGQIDCSIAMDGKDDWYGIEATGKGRETRLTAVPPMTRADEVLDVLMLAESTAAIPLIVPDERERSRILWDLWRERRVRHELLRPAFRYMGVAGTFSAEEFLDLLAGYGPRMKVQSSLEHHYVPDLWWSFLEQILVACLDQAEVLVAGHKRLPRGPRGALTWSLVRHGHLPRAAIPWRTRAELRSWIGCARLFPGQERAEKSR